MPGTITFRPIEANLTHNTDLIGKMNPYCAFIVGDSIFKGQVCKHGGKHPQWNDAVTVPVSNQNQVIVELMDKDRFSRDDNIGSFLLNLNELSQSGQSSRWYPLTYKNKPAGEILLETSFSGDLGFGQSGLKQTGYEAGYGSEFQKTGYEQTGYAQQTGLQQGGIVEQEKVIIEQPAVIEQEIVRETVAPIENRNVFTEQSQVIEPRTFLKEVDVVETRAHLETVEVLEPHKVVKDVQYTQAVPVTKQIEVVEPQVVTKEVEVIEPRLVTKTIQVVENVPVMKQVEVIESVPRIQTVETFEPQTFTKQVEVTDYVPVQKQVTVTEPVHLKKAVEFVEPVITTKTITKEIAQPVIIDEKITTTVGPASIVAETEIYEAEFARLGISSEERMIRFNEWNRLRGEGYNDQRLEEYFTTKGWGPVHQYRFNDFHRYHNLGHLYGKHHGSHFSKLGISHDEGINRYNVWNRLRNQGYNDQRLEEHFNTQGWGPVSQYRFNEFHNNQGLSSQYGNQYGSQFGKHNGSHHFSNLGISHDEGINRYNVWNKLRNQGYNDQRLEEHFNTQGWGPVNQYRFNEFSSQYGNQYGSQVGGPHYSSNPLSQKY